MPGDFIKWDASAKSEHEVRGAGRASQIHGAVRKAVFGAQSI